MTKALPYNSVIFFFVRTVFRSPCDFSRTYFCHLRFVQSSPWKYASLFPLLRQRILIILFQLFCNLKFHSIVVFLLKDSLSLFSFSFSVALVCFLSAVADWDAVPNPAKGSASGLRQRASPLESHLFRCNCSFFENFKKSLYINIYLCYNKKAEFSAKKKTTTKDKEKNYDERRKKKG